MTKQERETLIRFDATGEPAHLSTFDPVVARAWTRVGVKLTQRGDEWIGLVDKKFVKVRRRRMIAGKGVIPPQFTRE
jgi:hypothetical protein